MGRSVSLTMWVIGEKFTSIERNLPVMEVGRSASAWLPHTSAGTTIRSTAHSTH